MARLHLSIAFLCCINAAETGQNVVAEQSQGPAAKADRRVDSPSPTSIDELLLFFPTKYPAGDWAPRNLKFRDLTFEADDKTKLHAWYCPCDRPRATILIAHGNGGNLAGRAEWLTILQTRLRVSTFLFDYRGYGKSEGAPTVEGVFQDARAARTKLCEVTGLKPSDIILMGDSLGGAIVVQLAAEEAPRALILQSTFSSLKDVAAVHYPKLAWLVPPEKLESTTQIAKYRGPLLQSHGVLDRVIPFESAVKLFKAANQPKSFITIAEADHNDWLRPEYLQMLDQFITRLETPVK